MDMIKEYNSDSPTSEENEDIFVPKSRELDACSVRKVYLITYSQVDEELFPTRRSFVDAVKDCNVVQWCCSLKQHISASVHYIWPSSWTETNGGFPARDFYWGGVGSQSISPKFTQTIIACGSVSQRKTSIILRVKNIQI